MLRSSILLVLCATAASFATVHAVFCGPAAVPFSFEALPDGQPVLGCARPTCFGWDAQGHAAGAASVFYRINKRPDGFFRKNADTQPRALSSWEASLYHPQTATCADSFDAEHCSDDDQWVGGIGPVANFSSLPMALQCCKYEPLRLAQDRGIAVVNQGQIVIGGEVHSGERQYAFDYISDVTKQRRDDGTIFYEVSVKRLACLPHPREFSVSVEPSLQDDIITRFTKKNKARKGNHIAFQAPTQNFADGNLEELPTNGGNQPPGQVISQSERTVLEPTNQETVQVVRGQPEVVQQETVIQGPFVAEQDAIVEEVQAVQGLELPPGQVPQGLVEAPAQAPAYGQGYSGYSGYGAPNYGSYGGYSGYSGYSGYGAAPAAGGGGGGGGLFCFTADTELQLFDGTTKRMDELKIGDWIMTANNERLLYTVVESWVHRVPQQLAKFQRIELSDGRVLKITDKHFIYRTTCDSGENLVVPFKQVNPQPVYAERVAVDDCLYVQEKDQLIKRRVVSVNTVQERGIYSPMTSTGDMMVNGIYASCYNVVSSPIMQRSFFETIKNLPSIFSSSEESTDIPFATQFIIDMLQFILPYKTLFI